MAALNAAYDVLGDPVKRQEYDEWLLRDESAASRSTPTPVPTVTQPSRSRRRLIWWVIGPHSILGALGLWFILPFVTAGGDASRATPPDSNRFELKQDGQGRLVRLDKMTGEVTTVNSPPAGSRRTRKVATDAAKGNSERVGAIPDPGPLCDQAGGSTPHTVTVSTENTPLFMKPRVLPVPLTNLSAGSVVPVVEMEGDWYLIRFKDRRWGSRVGYIHCSDVRPHTGG